MSHVQLTIHGMHCASCTSRVEQALEKVPGVRAAAVNLATSRADVELTDDQMDSEVLLQAVTRSGYAAELCAATTGIADKPKEDERRVRSPWRMRLIVAVALLLVQLATRLLPGSMTWLTQWISFWAATVLWIYVSWPYLVGAMRRLRYFSANMDTLVALGATTAYVAGAASFLSYLKSDAAPVGYAMTFLDSGMILTFVTLGKVLEEGARQRAANAVRGVLELAPDVALRVRDGQTRQLPTAEIIVNDTVLVRPGDRVPLDGVVLSGTSAVDQSWLTGESLPVDTAPGSQVYAGTINGEGSLAVRVTRATNETALARIAELVERAQQSKADVQRAADLLVAYLVPAVLLVALNGLLVWTLAGDVHAGVRAAVAVLVVACPCAMGLATPTAVMVGSGRAARQGILFKEAQALEVAGRLTAIVLDKTGTITHGRHDVVDVFPATDSTALRPMAEKELLATAAAAEQLSQHPLADAVVKAARQRGLRLPQAHDLQAIPGAGIKARCRAGTILVGNETLLADHGIETLAVTARIDAVRSAGQTPLVVALGKQLLGVIAVADVIAENSHEAIWKLKELGLRLLMVTGDHRLTAEAVARQLSIHQVVAQVKPVEKQKIVAQLQEIGEIVGMVGDGINDAAALATADLGIAIGTGADVAVEAADIVLSGNDLRDVHQAILLSKATLRTIRQNLFWAFAYNALLIPLAVTGLVPPAAAAAAMALSSVSVVSNSLLLRTKRLK